MAPQKTWHDRYQESLSFGQKFADTVVAVIGSWRFIVVQAIVIALWMIINLCKYFILWDPYPYTLLSLILALQAALSAPLIMLAQNHQADRDRAQANSDYRTNVESKAEIEELQIRLNSIEVDNIDKIRVLLEELKKEFERINAPEITDNTYPKYKSSLQRRHSYIYNESWRKNKRTCNKNSNKE